MLRRPALLGSFTKPDFAQSSKESIQSRPGGNFVKHQSSYFYRVMQVPGTICSNPEWKEQIHGIEPKRQLKLKFSSGFSPRHSARQVRSKYYRQTYRDRGLLFRISRCSMLAWKLFISTWGAPGLFQLKFLSHPINNDLKM